MLFFLRQPLRMTDRKQNVIVTKQDKDTENPLDGGIFGLYAASDIKNADGRLS